MIPKHLTIRGALGFESFSKGNLEIDFTQLTSGLIAVVAPNGTGKTTLLELLSPYNELPSHGGAFAKNFYAKDSLKDYVFEYGGSTYRVKSIIDGEKGKCATWLYKNDVPLNADGKGFDALAEKEFGPKNIFFKSVFMKQPTILSDDRGIISMENAPAKEFFYQLMPGFDKYPHVTKIAAQLREKEEATGLKLITVRDTIRRSIEANNIDIQKEPEVAVQIETILKEIDTHKILFLNKQLELKEFEKRFSSQQDIYKNAQRLKDEIKKAENFKSDLEGNRAKALADIDAKHSAQQKEIERINKIIENADVIKEKVARLEVVRLDITGYDKLKAEHIAATLKRDNVNIRIYSHQTKIEMEISNINKELTRARTASSQLDTVPCRDMADLVSACPLILNARDARDCIQDLETKLAEIANKTEPVDLLKDLAATEAEIAGLQYDDKARADHQELKRELEELSRNDWSKFKADLDKSESILSEKQKMLETLFEQRGSTAVDYAQRVETEKGRISAFGIELEAVQLQLAEFGESLLADLSKAKNEVAAADKLLANLSENLGRYRGRLELIANLKVETDKLVLGLQAAEAEIDLNNRNIAEYSLIERAFGRNEIPAMKLEAIAPEISSTATEILNGFGIDWIIDIKTTRRDSKDKKDIETFNIVIARNGGEVVCKDLSGGQQVWVELALRNAIAIYVTNHSGRDYRTMFRDESDGPLDVEKARAFLDVARSTHKLTGAYYTFIITQRPDIYEQIEQRLVFNKQVGQVEIEAA